MATEPPVRVGNGSVLVKLDTAMTGVAWTQAGPWRWVRKGPQSDEGLGQEWVTVNGHPVAGNRVLVTTSEGELFFTFVGGRTHLDTNVRFELRAPRELFSRTAELTGVAVSTENEEESGPDWNFLSVSLQG